MSRAAILFAELAARGISVRAKGDTLGVTPRAALTPELQTRIVDAKQELLSLLAPASALNQELAIREVLGLRAEWLVGLELPPVLVLAVPEMVCVDFREGPRNGAFDAVEWLAIVRAAELGRGRAADLRGWAQRKRSELSFRVREFEAAGGHIRGERQPMTTVQVLGEYGAELRAVLIEAARERPSIVSAAETDTAQDVSAERNQADRNWHPTPDEARAPGDPQGSDHETVGQ